MDDFLIFVQKNVVPLLESDVVFNAVVKVAESVIELVINLAHNAPVYTKAILCDSFRLLKEKIQNLADWIVHASREGLSSLKQYLQAHPHLLNGLKEPVGKLVAKLTILACGKVAARHGTKVAAKQTTKVAAKQVTKVASKQVTKVATKQTTKVVAKQAAKVGTRTTLHVAVTAATNPAGIVADVAQVGFEVAGKPGAGKVVGSAGNIVGGAVTGSIVGGPVGALIGAAVAGGIWGVGELVGYAMGQ